MTMNSGDALSKDAGLQWIDAVLSTAPQASALSIARESFIFFLVATIPAIFFAYLGSAILPELFTGGSERAFQLTQTRHIISAILVGPAIETAALALTIYAIRKILAPDRRKLVVILSASLWAALHGIVSVGWGLTVFWPFVIYSTAYLRWEPRGSGWSFTVAAISHSLTNVVAVCFALLA